MRNNEQAQKHADERPASEAGVAAIEEADRWTPGSRSSRPRNMAIEIARLNLHT
jgi:hypothetical protein